jgi:hypothetical protein
MNRIFVKYWHEVRIGLAIALLLLCLYELLISSTFRNSGGETESLQESI